MSRIGKKTIQIPQGVTIEINNSVLMVKGPKGALTRNIHPHVSVEMNDGIVSISVKNEQDKQDRSLWGTFGAHIKNMILGVTEGFKKQLEINGVGYRLAMQGKDIKVDAGFSHPVLFPLPEGINATVEKNAITFEGIDKELLGQTTAKFRSIREPEPYKGKGIKYMDETIRRKAGKAAAKG